jgi:hypothetical protein
VPTQFLTTSYFIDEFGERLIVLGGDDDVSGATLGLYQLKEARRRELRLSYR